MHRYLARLLCCLWLLPALAAAQPEKRLEIYWCDVEGGAATLIVTPAGESLLIDSGWPGERDPERIMRLARDVAGVNQIDHYVTSHWHRDHFGGIGRLAELLPVVNYYDHGFPPLPQPDIDSALVETYLRVSKGKGKALKAGDQIALRQSPGQLPLSLKIIASNGTVLGEDEGAQQVRECVARPAHESKPVDTSDNARSVAFVLSFGTWKFFNAADLTWNLEHQLACPAELVGKVDVYQVTHHGSDSSNHPALLKVLDPVVAVMNNGPRKGGSAAAIRAVRSGGSLKGFFALHRNVTTPPEDNAAVEFTANDEEECRGEYVKLRVDPDARSYAVEVPSKGTVGTFRSR